jgi:hypothetical protein
MGDDDDDDLPPLATRDEFLTLLWTDIINGGMGGEWLDNVISSSEKRPNEPFADTGPLVKRLLAAGASRRDLCLFARSVSYQAVFSLLYLLGDPGIDPADLEMIYEELLCADPSGKEGRPGSAPPDLSN